MSRTPAERAGEPSGITLFLSGDVMTGRGIDQVMATSCHPVLYESFVTDARRYVRLAEAVNGRIPAPVPPDYIWGEALQELERRRPAARIINLETSITTYARPWPKGINYRMHPGNVNCLQAAGIDCCVLGNNHVLDWGRNGLEETLTSLASAGIAAAGAGPNGARARAPAGLPTAGGGRLLVFSAATGDSGVPEDWAAARHHAGINRLPDLSQATLTSTTEHIESHRRSGDRVIFSVHWGGNWGFAVPAAQRAFARGLIDSGAVDLVHGHSSHHVKGLELYRNRLILYGCGDLLNDYEGIGGQEHYRGELSLLYFPRLDANTGRLLDLELVPTRVRRFRLERAASDDATWLWQTLERESRRLGTHLPPPMPDGSIHLASQPG